ncbi:TonB-dependent receptor [Massilia agilis]|uniref:TonB-dependent receptor n=1 Tax=Massilia agilis TaxID=1811226 RepID=A0ABT2DDQ3_9BURK|nr:TonB-dependent receptor [Massilia agilis]MCS0808566.1 TonB-dependent receptor [Massilia agilis]
MNATLNKRLLAVAIAATLPCHAALAGNDQANLPKVTITGTKADVTQVDVSRAGFPTDTAGLLQQVPGMSIVSGGGVSGLPSMRGLADDRLRIQVDGMDIVSACANHMNPALSYIAPSQVDSVQVLAGITPVSAGGDSIGGTIRVRSADPRFAAPGAELLKEGQAALFYRSNGNVRDASLSATLATERFSATYSGESVKSDNYHAGGDFKPATTPAIPRALPHDEVGSSAYESRNQSVTLAVRSEQRLVELRMGMQHIPYEGFANQRMDLTRNDSQQFNLRLQERHDWGTLEARAYHEHTRHGMNFGDDKLYWYGAKSDIPGMPMETEGRNTGLSAKASVKLSDPDLLRIGAEYQRYRLNDWWPPSGGGMAPDTFWNIRDGQRDRLAAYAEWDRRWSPEWFSQFGIRGENVTSDAGAVQGYSAAYATDAKAFNDQDRHRKDHNLDLTAQARYAPDRDATYKFGYARKTRSPNLYERYSWSTGGMAMNMVNIAGDGNGYVGDVNLRPEVAHTVTASADWHDEAQERWFVTVAPYYTYVKDYVDARCLTAQCARNAFVFLRFANQDARLYGAEFSGRALLARGAYGNLSASGLVNYVVGKNKTTGDNLYNIAPLNARLSLVHQLGAWSNTMELQATAAKDRVSQLRNELKTGGFALLNLRTSYAWKHVQLDAGVENLFDRRYDLPLGGAYVGQGRTMSQSGTPYGIAVPGMGRSVYAGLTFKL